MEKVKRVGYQPSRTAQGGSMKGSHYTLLNERWNIQLSPFN